MVHQVICPKKKEDFDWWILVPCPKSPFRKTAPEAVGVILFLFSKATEWPSTFHAFIKQLSKRRTINLSHSVHVSFALKSIIYVCLECNYQCHDIRKLAFFLKLHLHCIVLYSYCCLLHYFTLILLLRCIYIY